MAESYSVQAVLSVLDRGFTSGMQRASAVAKNLGSTTRNIGSGIVGMGAKFGIAATVAGMATSAISAGFGEVIHSLNESSAAWQTFEGNMRQLGQTPAQIKRVRSELSDFATKSIYSASDMASTYSQLAAVGIKSADKLVTGFGGLAAAAENPKQAMKTLSMQATQMASKPKVQWMDFKLMLEQTPAGIAAVAKAMGMTTSQLVKNVQDGKVKTEDFFNAIKQVGNGGQFQKMATQYKTVGQAMDGLVETVTTKLQPAFDAISKVIIGVVGGLADMISKGGPGAAIIGTIAVVLGTLAVALTVATIAQLAFNAILALNPWVLIIAGIMAVIAGLTYFFTQTQLGKSIWGGFVNFMIGLWNRFANVIKAIGAIAGIVIAGVVAIAGAFKIFQGAVMVARTAMMLFNIVMTANPLGVVIMAITAVVAALVWFFTQTQLGQQLWQGFVTFLSTAWQSLVAIATTVWTAISTVISVAWTVISTVIMTGVSAVVAFFSGAWNGLVSIVSAVWNGIVAVVSGAISAVMAVIHGISAVIGFIGSVMSSIASHFSSGWNRAKSITSQGINAAKNAVTSAAGAMVSAGRNFVQGFVNGITGFISHAAAAAARMAKAALNAAKSALGIHSPSRVMRDEVGYYVAAGFAKGIIGNTSAVVKASRNLADSAVVDTDMFNISDQLSNLASLGNQAFNANYSGDMQLQGSSLEQANNQLLRQIADKDSAIYLDGDALVGGTYERYDAQLGQSYDLQGRFS